MLNVRPRVDSMRSSSGVRVMVGRSATKGRLLLDRSRARQSFRARAADADAGSPRLTLHFDKSGAMILSKEEGRKGENSLELPQGTLDLLILKTVALEPQHGWAIAARLRQLSSEALAIRQGSLYPALHRLERRGWIKARWATTDNNRRAKYYELTRLGRKQLEVQADSWRRLAAAVGQILDMA